MTRSDPRHVRAVAKSSVVAACRAAEYALLVCAAVVGGWSRKGAKKSV